MAIQEQLTEVGQEFDKKTYEEVMQQLRLQVMAMIEHVSVHEPIRPEDQPTDENEIM